MPSLTAGVGPLWQKIAVWRPAAVVFIYKRAATIAAGRALEAALGAPGGHGPGRTAVLPDAGSLRADRTGRRRAQLPAEPGVVAAGGSSVRSRVGRVVDVVLVVPGDRLGRGQAQQEGGQERHAGDRAGRRVHGGQRGRSPGLPARSRTASTVNTSSVTEPDSATSPQPRDGSSPARQPRNATTSR